jgi:hypothetical protein
MQGGKMKIYISGKITGLPINKVVEKFKWHSGILEMKGYLPVNPIDVSPFAEDKEWEDYMIDDIAALFKCDAIYMLKDWGQSKGARIEYQIAKELGLQILFEDELLV